MDGDVHRPVGANVHHAHAASVERGAQLVEPLQSGDGHAVGGRDPRQVEPVRRPEQRLEAVGRDEIGLRKEREDAAAVVVDDDERAVDVAPAGRDQAARVVEEREITEQRERAPAGVPAARPRAVDTTPSMPLAPRFATTRTPSRGDAYHSRSRTGIDDETMSVASLGSRSSRARATPGSVGAVCASSTDAMVAWARRSASIHPSSHPGGDGTGRATVTDAVTVAAVRSGSSHACRGCTST